MKRIYENAGNELKPIILEPKDELVLKAVNKNNHFDEGGEIHNILYVKCEYDLEKNIAFVFYRIEMNYSIIFGVVDFNSDLELSFNHYYSLSYETNYKEPNFNDYNYLTEKDLIDLYKKGVLSKIKPDANGQA